jgi:hypothetical protein
LGKPMLDNDVHTDVGAPPRARVSRFAQLADKDAAGHDLVIAHSH